MTTITRKAAVTVATVAAGLAGVASMLTFAPMAYADSCAFTRDLTVGASGADVTCLQNGLIAAGFSIPAGATGYFGSQTQAAVMAWQAKAGISPAAGYFGPISRAAWGGASMGTGTGTLPAGCTSTSGFSTTTGQSCSVSTLPAGCTSTVGFSPTTGQSCSAGGSTTVGGLSGGEANLTDYNLSAEDGDGAEAQQDAKIATAEFDVEDGDVSVQRAELTVNSTGTGSASDRPWDYFDTISVWGDGKKLADVDAGSRSDWDDNDDGTYTITVSGLNYVVKQGDKAELTFAADMNSSMDTDDITDGSFDVYVDTNGIRAVDGAGIQQYVGDADEDTNFSFQAEENGDLSVRDSDEDPDATTLKVEDDKTSDEYTVFAFDIRNKDDADTTITDLTVGTTSASTGFGSGVSLKDVVRKATLSVGGDDFDGDINDDGTIDFNDMDAQVDGNTTETFTLKVEFATDSAYAAGLPSTLGFMVDNSDISAEGTDSGDEVDSGDINGSATGEDHTLSETGFDVTASNVSSSLIQATDTTDAKGSYSITFKVTADEDDATYIPTTAASSTSATAGAVYRILKDNVVFTGGLDTNPASAVLEVVNNATTDDDSYRINAGATATFKLTVTIDPATAGNYAIELYQVHSGAGADTSVNHTDTFNVDTDDADFQTTSQYIDA